MQSSQLAEIERALSRPRLEAYRPSGGDDLDRLANYLWNVALCEALYPALQALEVALRNALDRHISSRYGTPYWFRCSPGPDLTMGQRNQVAGAESELVKRGLAVQPGRVVAELHFGFWTLLLSRRFERALWQGGRAPLAAVFPAGPPGTLTRADAYTRLNELRMFRNRVFHHEPIWNRPALDVEHSHLLETVRWMSPALEGTLLLVDRFQSTLQSGRAPFRSLLV